MPIVSTSTSAFFERARRDMSSLRSQAEDLQAQLGNGQRLSRSSDDPVAASRLRALQRLEQLSTIDTTNANRANADLSLADGAMSSIADTIIRAKELALQASNGTLTDTQRASIGQELEAIGGNLLALANTRDSSGHALFGGESAGDAYALDASGSAVYVGTGTSGELPLGEGQSVTRSLTGPEFLNFSVKGQPTDLLAVVNSLAAALQGGASDPAAAASDAVASLSAGLDSVTTAQTVIGARLSWIDLTTQRRTDLSELRTNEETTIGSTDIAATVTQLQQTMLVLEASQASFNKLASLTLFNQLN